MIAAGDHKDLRILLEIQQRALGPVESDVGVTYLSMRIHLKSYPIFPLKFSATLLNGYGREQLEHIRHIVKVCVEATS